MFFFSPKIHRASVEQQCIALERSNGPVIGQKKSKQEINKKYNNKTKLNKNETRRKVTEILRGEFSSLLVKAHLP